MTPLEPLVDTHCHLYFDAFDADREAVITRAREFGVRYLVNVGIDPATNEAAYAIAKDHDFIFSTLGLHPHSSQLVTDAEMDSLQDFIDEKKPVAIGEIGLDYVKSEADAETQKTIFKKMLHLALKNNLPVIVHSRSALDDTLSIIKAESGGKMKGVMHCFSYDRPALDRLLDLGFNASFTCNITFKNAAALLAVAAEAPLDRIMLETDSPYLAPQIYRGKRNEPSCVSHLADFLAEARGIDRAQLARVTTKTAVEFFGLPPA